MKIKDGFILRQVAGNFVVVAIGDEAVNFNAMITLNDTGAFLWEKLQNEITKEELLRAFLSEYDVDKETATKDLEEFIKQLEDGKLLV